MGLWCDPMTIGGGTSGSRALVFSAAAFTLLCGCSDEESQKHWSALATCLAGPAASAPIAERVPKLRQLMLGSSPASAGKDAWPKSCASHADDLYAALDNSGKTAILRRKLHDRFGCSDAKGSCAIAFDSSLISVTTELWEAAKDAELKIVPGAGGPAPAAAPPPVVDSKGWKSFSAEPERVSGPVLTSDGRALLALKKSEGRVRPTVCEFAADFGKVRCVKANDKVPELPPQSVEIVNDAGGLYAAGLTETGLVAYNVENGETSAVAGRSGRLLRDGVAVEKAGQDVSLAAPDPSAKPAKPAKSAKGRGMFEKPKGAAAVEEGYVAIELAGGKASKGTKLKLEGTVGDPIALGDQILYLSPTESGVELGVKSLSRGRLKDGGHYKGNFAGAFHTCRAGDTLGVAVFGSRSGQGSGKATGGEGKTAVTVMLFEKGSWSKPAELTMPFDCTGESELVCSASGASLAWMKTEKGSATVGRIDCTMDGCKPSDVKLPAFDSTYLWAVGPLGDKVYVLYRAALGETRVRLAPLSGLAGAKDTIVFDTGDFGGPTTGDLTALSTDAGALFLFRSEAPVALRLGSDGTIGVVSS